MSVDDRDARLAAGAAAWGVEQLERLAGDASTRRYVRGRRAGASVVVLDDGAPIASEAAHPLLRWQRFYRDLAIRVPEVLSVDAPRGLILLEDLGDALLQGRVERDGAEACRAHYERAAEWALRLAREGTPRFAPDGARSDDPLTSTRLAVEMDLFLAHAARRDGRSLVPEAAGETPLLRARRSLDAASGRLAEARRLLHALCHDVHSGAPMVLCHRDYHARNLMLVPGGSGREEVAVIDFQDTRRGPRAYDLASLAWDPYVTLPDALIADLVELWRPPDAARERWSAEVALAAGQRLIKAAGSYAWLGHACGRAEYLQWYRPALDRALARLEPWPRRDALRLALADVGALA